MHLKRWIIRIRQCCVELMSCGPLPILLSSFFSSGNTCIDHSVIKWEPSFRDRLQVSTGCRLEEEAGARPY